MTPKQIDLVQQSLPAVLALRDRVPARFHEHLLALDPASRPVFSGADMRRQGSLLVNAAATAIEALRSAGHDCAGAALCQYHLSYGIGPHHFRTAGAALARALEEELGSGFTAELGEAWAAACEWVGRATLEAPHPLAA